MTIDHSPIYGQVTPPECAHCRPHDPCKTCGTRRDEHDGYLPDPTKSPVAQMLHDNPSLRADHPFVVWPEATPDHYVGADYITDCQEAS